MAVFTTRSKLRQFPAVLALFAIITLIAGTLIYIISLFIPRGSGEQPYGVWYCKEPEFILEIDPQLGSGPYPGTFVIDGEEISVMTDIWNSAGSKPNIFKIYIDIPGGEEIILLEGGFIFRKNQIKVLLYSTYEEQYGEDTITCKPIGEYVID